MYVCTNYSRYFVTTLFEKMTKFKYIAFLLASLLLLTNCAKRGTITGGDKDTIAPKIINSNPDNFTTNFKGNEIKISFNELFLNSTRTIPYPITDNIKETNMLTYRLDIYIFTKRQITIIRKEPKSVEIISFFCKLL
mgnify:CR=1 FL=1